MHTESGPATGDPGDWTVTVLAGGSSTRFGDDKRKAVVARGLNPLENAVSIGISVAESVIVVVGVGEAETVQIPFV